MLLLAKTKLNTIDVLIPKTLIDSNIGHDEFVSINNVLDEYEDMKKKIEISNNIKWIFIVSNV